MSVLISRTCTVSIDGAVPRWPTVRMLCRDVGWCVGCVLRGALALLYLYTSIEQLYINNQVVSKRTPRESGIKYDFTRIITDRQLFKWRRGRCQKRTSNTSSKDERNAKDCGYLNTNTALPHKS